MSDLVQDLTSPEGRDDGITGELVPGVNGYLRAVLTEKTRGALQSAFRESIAAVIKEHEPLDSRREANLRAYEAQPEPDKAITIPSVKRDVNQQRAWLCDAIFSKDPMFTVRALDSDPIEVFSGGAQTEMIAADEYARRLQALVNFYAVHRIGFKKTLRTFITELLRDGNRPPILKVIHDEREREYRGLNIVKKDDDRTIERIEKDPVYWTAKEGEAIRIEVIPGDKFFVPFPWDDAQRAPYVFQAYEESIATIKDKIATGAYDFCRGEEDPDPVEVDMVLSGSTTRDDVERWRADDRNPTTPTKDQKLYELWFDLPFAEKFEATPEVPSFTDPLTGETIPGEPATEERIETRMVPMCVVVHAASGLWLNCYENHRWDRIRPFFAGRMQERPFSFSGYSTAENIAPHQKLITQLFNARLQNIAVANVQTLGIREGSTTWRFFAKNRGQLRPGTIWPFQDPNDIKSEPLGRNVESTAAEINYLTNESDKMSTVYDYDRGQVPNRTPVGTVEAVDSLAKMQPRMVLDQIRDVISEVLECLVRTLAQFRPEGLRVPYRDPTTTDGVDVTVVGFPVQWRDGLFEFDIAATGNEETAQSLTMRDLMLADRKTQFDGEVMSTVAATMTPNPENGMMPPPPLMFLGLELLKGKRRILSRVFEHAKLNPDDYLPPLQMLEQLPKQLMQLQAIAAQAQAQAQGGQGGVPADQSGGPVPPQEGGGAPVPLVEGAPGNGRDGQGAFPPNL